MNYSLYKKLKADPVNNLFILRSIHFPRSLIKLKVDLIKSLKIKLSYKNIKRKKGRKNYRLRKKKKILNRILTKVDSKYYYTRNVNNIFDTKITKTHLLGRRKRKSLYKQNLDFKLLKKIFFKKKRSKSTINISLKEFILKAHLRFIQFKFNERAVIIEKNQCYYITNVDRNMLNLKCFRIYKFFRKFLKKIYRIIQFSLTKYRKNKKKIKRILKKIVDFKAKWKFFLFMLKSYHINMIGTPRLYLHKKSFLSDYRLLCYKEYTQFPTWKSAPRSKPLKDILYLYYRSYNL